MKETLIKLLESFGYPVYLQGAMSNDEVYPESFFTFWNNDTPESVFYGNRSYATVWDFDVNFYSCDPILTNSKILEARHLLKENGFIVDGKGYDVISDEKSHTGRGMNVLYLEREE